MFSRCCVWEIDTPFTFKIVAFFSKDLAQLSGWIDLQWLLCWYQKSHHPPSCISYSYTLGNSRWRVCIKNNFTCLNASERHIRLALYLHYTSKVQKNFEFGAKGQKGPEATESSKGSWTYYWRNMLINEANILLFFDTDLILKDLGR